MMACTMRLENHPADAAPIGSSRTPHHMNGVGATIRVGCLLVLAFCLPPPAFAQHAFVQGGYGVDFRRFSGQETDAVFDANAATVTFGGAGFLTTAVSAGLEVELGATSEVQQSVTLPLAGRPDIITTMYSSRRRSISAMAGFHGDAAPPVRVGVYGGLSFLAFRRITSSDAPPVVLTDPQPPTVFTDRAVVPVVQVDVAIRLTRYLAAVGTVRARGLELTSELRGFSVQPGAVLRVTF